MLEKVVVITPTLPSNHVTDPDIVIHDKASIPQKMILLELTCSWDSAASFHKAEARKTDWYDRLCLDLEEAGLQAINMPLEVGTRQGLHKSEEHDSPGHPLLHMQSEELRAV